MKINILFLLIFFPAVALSNVFDVVLQSKEFLNIINVEHCDYKYTYDVTKGQVRSPLDIKLLCISDTVLRSVQDGNPKIYLSFTEPNTGLGYGYLAYNRQFYVDLKKKITRK